MYLEVAELRNPAILALEDGSVFRGVAIGVEGEAGGEAVFNTAITGYQEILTDPSYAGQIVTLTYPHIGNTGINTEDWESTRVYAAGLVIRDLPPVYSNWRATEPLDALLRRQGVVAIAEVDTRRLTRVLREKGAQRACLLAGPEIDPDRAVERARTGVEMLGQDLARIVSTAQPYEWSEGDWRVGEGYATAPPHQWNVVAYDYGVKRNLLRLLTQRGCRVTVVPALTAARDVLALRPHGIFLSNGPGDPQACSYAIDAIRELCELRIPLFGVCLGHQLLALASGARTVKLKFGHHGANHPVLDIATGQVSITSQNHGFAVDETTLPPQLRITHRSLFDGSVQGIERSDCPAFGFQGHPEASPGPHDVANLFDHFIALMRTAERA